MPAAVCEDQGVAPLLRLTAAPALTQRTALAGLTALTALTSVAGLVLLGTPASASVADGRYEAGSTVTVYGRTQGLQVALTRVDVSGLDPTAAGARVAQQVTDGVRMRTIHLTMHPHGGRASGYRFSAGSLVPAIAAPELAAAGDQGATMSVVVPLSATFLASTVDRLATRPLLNPVNAVARVRGRAGIVISRSRSGVAVERRTAPADIVAALAADAGATVELRLSALEPAVSTRALNTVIVIRRGANTLQHFRNGRLVKTYRVATGAPGYPTPLGVLRVVAKQRAPSWYNPHSTWSRDLPDVIGPGPDNPLGTRALALSAPGVLIHGVPAVENSSIGTNASHGCIRMLRSDVEELFPTVPAGATVIVLA
jgi:lipoprotein-anchoring transpeptidase ErfK/SrfK